MNEVTIRKAKKEELGQLLAFEQAIIDIGVLYDPTAKAKGFHYYDLDNLIESAEALVLVAEIDNEIVASGLGYIKPGNVYNVFAHYADLRFMYVKPEHRGKGINQLIIEELKNWAKSRGLSEIRLNVYDENTRAVKSYEKAGFKKILVEMRMQIDL